MKVFCINGIAEAGKDTFVNTLREESGLLISRHSTVDPVCDLYREMGWDGTKSPENRKALNELKRIWIALNDGPTERVMSLLRGDNARGVDVAFVMVREFEEMMKLVRRCTEVFGWAGTLEVVRDGVPIPPIEQEFLLSHPARYMYNVVVWNKTTDDSTFPELRKSVSNFVERLAIVRDPNRYLSIGTHFDLPEYEGYRRTI